MLGNELIESVPPMQIMFADGGRRYRYLIINQQEVRMAKDVLIREVEGGAAAFEVVEGADGSMTLGALLSVFTSPAKLGKYAKDWSTEFLQKQSGASDGGENDA
jgi:hypothetical protein